MCMCVHVHIQLDEDMDGHVEFLSQTGPFSVPVRCQAKKCQVKLDRGQVEFDHVCVGDTSKRRVTIHNTGALPTLFTVTAMQRGSIRGTVDSRSGVLVGMVEPDVPIPSESGGKLSNKSDLSVMSDLGVYDYQLSLASDTYSAKSKSAGNLSVYFATHTLEEGEGLAIPVGAMPTLPPPPVQGHDKKGVPNIVCRSYLHYDIIHK